MTRWQFEFETTTLDESMSHITLGLCVIDILILKFYSYLITAFNLSRKIFHSKDMNATSNFSIYSLPNPNILFPILRFYPF